MNSSDFRTPPANAFYGGTAPAEGNGQAMEVAPEVAGSGHRPAHFWLIMIGLLIAARLFYEWAEKA